MADHEIYEDRIALEHVRRQLSTDSEDFPDEILDPRIQTELEKLNKASEEINKLELELDDARSSFRQALSESTQKLNTLAKKLGSCIEKARPYYDARVKAKEIHMETQKVALRYERACSMHEAAKEMVQLAEQGYVQRDEMSDPAWQEMLNHATMKVNEAEKERNESEREHERVTQTFKQAEDRVQFLQRNLKRAIAKSNLSTRRSFLQLSSIANQHWLETLPYFEMKIKFNQLMEDQKLKVGTLEEDVTSSKALYSQALHSLEAISDEIHRNRLERRKNIQLGIRSAGVGAEDPAPPPSWDSSSLPIDGSTAPRLFSCSDTNIAEMSATKTKEIHHHQSKSNVLAESFSDSLIFSSPERARSQSYRTAIETSQTNLPGLRSDHSPCVDEFDENLTCLDNEYMELPKTHSPRGRVDPRGSKSDSTVHPSQVNRSVSVSAQEGSYRGEPFARRSRANSQPIAIKGRVSDRESTDEQQSERDASFSHRSPKLQGLILRVDATMDPQAAPPMTHKYSTKPLPVSKPPTVSPQTDASVLPHAGSGKPVGRIVAVSPAPIGSDPLNVSSVLGPSSHDSTHHSQDTSPCFRDPGPPLYGLCPPSHDSPGRRSNTDMLSVDDSNSDTESIASTGGIMFDDDQIELLTKEFPKLQQPTPCDEDIESYDQQPSNRHRSSLVYLEDYLSRRRSLVLKQNLKLDSEDLASQTDCDGDTATLKQKTDCDGDTATLNQKTDCDGDTATLNQKTDCDGDTATFNQKTDCDGDTATFNQKTDCDGDTATFNQKTDCDGDTATFNQKTDCDGDTATFNQKTDCDGDTATFNQKTLDLVTDGDVNCADLKPAELTVDKAVNLTTDGVNSQHVDHGAAGDSNDDKEKPIGNS